VFASACSPPQPLRFGKGAILALALELRNPDGQRFLVNARVQGPESPPLNVVVNGAAEHNAQ